jgi:poly(A) polymerase
MLQEKTIKPTLINSDLHNILSSQINKNITNIIAKLQQAHFKAYIVGGGVRDLLLGLKPKDFDIATDAKPDEIKELFKNCRIIGRRFRLAHIYFGRDIIEVATFRAAPPAINNNKNNNTEPDYNAEHMAIDGQIIRDNIYGTLEEDIWRRDFTINALYYNPIDNTIIDYCNGFADIKNKQIKILGDAAVRFREDPVRMLRALRFAAKLEFNIDSNTNAIVHDYKYQSLLDNIPPARLFEEYNKLFLSGYSEKSFDILKKYNLLHKLFPLTATKQIENEFPQHLSFLKAVLQSTDNRRKNDLPINPAFLLAAFLWHGLLIKQRELNGSHNSRAHIWRLAIHRVLKQQNLSLSIPKRFTKTMEEIWDLQRLFNKSKIKAVTKAAHHPKFRAGFDFLMLRSQVENVNSRLLKWWQQYEAANHEARAEMLKNYKEL